MRKICVINQKGGVAKTTTAVSIAAGLARQDRKVLLIDLDPQGNIAHSLTTNKLTNLHDLLMGKCSYVDCISPLGTNLDVIHSNETLAKLDVFLAKGTQSHKIIQDKLSDISGYDYVIFDCAPSLGILNQSALLFSDEAIIPVSTQYLSMTGLTAMIETVNELNKHFGHNLKITHIVPTMYDARTRTNKEMLKRLNTEFKDLVSNPIRINSKLAEAPKSGKSIFSYAKHSRGARDYGDLVQLILLREPKTTVKSASQPISMRVQQMMKDVPIED